MRTDNQPSANIKANYWRVRQWERTSGFSFSIHGMGDYESGEQEYENPHRHPYFEVIWKTRGSCICQIDLRSYDMNDDSIYFVSPGQIHLLQPGADASGYVIQFSKEFIQLTPGLTGNNLYGDTMKTPSQYIIGNAAEKKDIENILVSMKKEFGSYSMLRPDILSGWLRIFLVYLNNLKVPVYSAPNHPRNIELVRKFYSLLEKDFLKRKMVADYAEELFISPSYLNEIIKRTSGFTVSHHIQQRIVLEAKRLAIYSSSSMKEIAYLLGYDDTAHFSKFFKTYSGTNFSEFKRSRPNCDAS